jgi:hypothetical protein
MFRERAFDILMYLNVPIHMWAFQGAWFLCDLVGKSVGERPLERTWGRWEDNIRVSIKDMGRGGMECIYGT